MKTFTKILLVAGLSTALFNCADAQRGRDNGRSSGRERNGNSAAVRTFPQSRTQGSNRSFTPQRNERTFSADRGNNNNRFNQQRNMVRRDNVRSNTPSTVIRERNTNVVRNSAYSRYRESPRYNNYYANNNYRYNRNYRSNYGRGFNGGYYTYHNRRYSYMYGPRYTVIPHSFISIHFGGNPYYFNNGFFYGYYSGYYQPIFPPLGIRIGVLPFGYSSLYVGGYPYYYYNGIYYRQYDDNNYEVVDPPMGATVYNLPDGAKPVVLNGEELYELNGTYYREEKNSKGEITYTVVGKNGEVNNSDNEINTPGVGNDSDDNLTVPPPSSLQMGDIVTQLPEGSKAVTINGEKMYVTPDNTYLKEDTDENGNVLYKVVGQ